MSRAPLEMCIIDWTVTSCATFLTIFFRASPKTRCSSPFASIAAFAGQKGRRNCKSNENAERKWRNCYGFLTLDVLCGFLRCILSSAVAPPPAGHSSLLLLFRALHSRFSLGVIMFQQNADYSFRWLFRTKHPSQTTSRPTTDIHNRLQTGQRLTTVQPQPLITDLKLHSASLIIRVYSLLDGSAVAMFTTSRDTFRKR